MTIKFASLCSSLHREYETENLKYAKKARLIVCENLGFEPHLRASCLPELSLRKSLKRFDNKDLKEENLQIHIGLFCNNVKKNILRLIPEQTHLIDRQEVENYIS